MTNTKTIKYYVKNNYGVTLNYLSNSNDQAVNNAIQGLTSQKTVSGKNMRHLQDLGFNFEQVLPE